MPTGFGAFDFDLFFRVLPILDQNEIILIDGTKEVNYLKTSNNLLEIDVNGKQFLFHICTN